MMLFWIILACTVFGVLLLACVIELSGLRNNFHGANGIFLFASGVVAVFSLPVVFIVTWIWGDIWTALKASLAGAAGYAAVYALVLRLFDRLGRASTRSSGSR